MIAPAWRPPAAILPLLPIALAVPHGADARSGRSPARAVYAAVETSPAGPHLNVYTQKVDRGIAPPQLLFSEPAPGANIRPGHLIAIRISPAGDRLAYALQYTPGGQVDGRVFLTDGRGGAPLQVLARAQDLHWSHDGRRLLYTLPAPEPLELPRDPYGPSWHVLDLERGRHELLAGHEAALAQFGGRLGGQLVFIKPGAFLGFGPSSLVLVDPDSHAVSERTVDLDLVVGDPRLVVSPGGRRAVLAVTTRQSTCEMHEVTSGGQMRRLVATPHHRCGHVEWNTDDEFYYGKESQPLDGRPATDGIAPHGYYGALSVWRYRFGSRSESEVVASHDRAVYRFQGLRPGRVIIVSRESARPSPHYALEMRRLDGSRPVTLRSGERELLFVGWLR